VNYRKKIMTSMFGSMYKAWVNPSTGEVQDWEADGRGRPHHGQKLPSPDILDKAKAELESQGKQFIEEIDPEEHRMTENTREVLYLAREMALQEGWINVVREHDNLSINSADEGVVAKVLDVLPPDKISNLYLIVTEGEKYDYIPVPKDMTPSEAWADRRMIKYKEDQIRATVNYRKKITANKDAEVLNVAERVKDLAFNALSIMNDAIKIKGTMSQRFMLRELYSEVFPFWAKTTDYYETARKAYEGEEVDMRGVGNYAEAKNFRKSIKARMNKT